MAIRPERLTVADYMAFPDDEVHRELIDGEIIVVPAPNARHQEIAGWIHAVLLFHIEEHGGGRVFIAPFDVILSEHDVLQPDVVFIAQSDLDVLNAANVKGSPTLAVEVVSDSRRDRVRKRERYEKAGVPIYWIVDPKTDVVEVYRLENGRYGDPEIHSPPDRLPVPYLPGLTLDLTRVFRR